MTSSSFSITPKIYRENSNIFDDFTTLTDTLSKERRVKKLEETVTTLSTLFYHHPQIFKNPHILKNVTSLASSFKHELMNKHELSSKQEYPMVVNETGKEEHSMTLSPALVAKSRVLSYVQKKLASKQEFPKKTIDIELASNCDLDILNKINTPNCLNNFEIHDIEFCYKILDIANWLEIASLYSRIDTFLGETYLPQLKERSFSIKELDKGSLSLNEELADTLYFYKLSKMIPEDLPKAHEASNKKIQQWLQLSANDNASVVKKCQQLGEMGAYLDSLDLSFAGTLKDEDVNAIIESQPYLKKLHLSSSEIKGNINLKNLKKLTTLNMGGCRFLTNDFGKHLQGLPLTSLNLTWCYLLTNDFGTYLQGLPLNSLNMVECRLLTNDFGKHLQGLPLNSLDLNYCVLLTEDFGTHLRELPLNSLNMKGCYRLTNDFGKHLQGLPLNLLSMSHCDRLTDDFGKYLQGLSLTSLNMAWHDHLTDDFGKHLQGLPLTSLNMAGCDHLTDDFGKHLQGLSLNSLDLSYCKLLTDNFGIYFQGLPLTSLNMAGCDHLTDDFGKHLQGLPLSSLSMSHCDRLTEDFCEHLRKLPLTSQDLNFAFIKKKW